MGVVVEVQDNNIAGFEKVNVHFFFSGISASEAKHVDFITDNQAVEFFL